MISRVWHPETENLFEQQGAFCHRGPQNVSLTPFSLFAIWTYVLNDDFDGKVAQFDF